MLLRARYAVSGTDPGYAPTRHTASRGADAGTVAARRRRYAHSTVPRCYAMSGTDMRPVRCPALTWRLWSVAVLSAVCRSTDLACAILTRPMRTGTVGAVLTSGMLLAGVAGQQQLLMASHLVAADGTILDGR
eukprot:2360297-Rhodomonas_salina.2